MAEISLTDFFNACHGSNRRILKRVAYHGVIHVLTCGTPQDRIVLAQLIHSWKPAYYIHAALKAIMIHAQENKPPVYGYKTPPPLELRTKFLNHVSVCTDARRRAIDTLRRRVNRVRRRYGVGPARGAWHPSEEAISARMGMHGHETKPKAKQAGLRTYRIEGWHERGCELTDPHPFAGRIYDNQYKAGNDAIKGANGQETFVVLYIDEEKQRTIWHSFDQVFHD
jgi:hypothetical protein